MVAGEAVGAAAEKGSGRAWVDEPCLELVPVLPAPPGLHSSHSREKARPMQEQRDWASCLLLTTHHSDSITAITMVTTVTTE